METISEASRVSTLNQAISIFAEPASETAAPSKYLIRVDRPEKSLVVELPFQRGPVGRAGENINGISDESLLEILIHRLKCFQAHAFASETNASALAHLQEALRILEVRSAARREAGVDGTREFMSGERGFQTQTS